MQTGSAAEIAEALSGTGYLTDDALATVTFLALRMERPLLLEGEPGTGKTALAEAIAEALDLPLVRLQCYEGIDATQALYDWDFPRQILHLRALEAAGAAAAAGGGVDVEEAEKSLYDERFLLARPVLAALQQSPGGAARRRGRPRRRRVRGVPARGAVDLPGHHPRARHRRRRDAAGGGADLQPDPRAARRAQAALPLPLDRPPGPRARGRDRPVPGARGLRGAGPSGRRRRPAAPGDRPAQAAGRRRDPRLGARAPPPRHRRARPRVRRPGRSVRW